MSLESLAASRASHHSVSTASRASSAFDVAEPAASWRATIPRSACICAATRSAICFMSDAPLSSADVSWA